MSTRLPGPRGVLRTLWQFNADPIGFIRRGHEAYGPIFGFAIGTTTFASVRDAETVADVLLNRSKVWRKDVFTREMRVILGQGLLTSHGDHWRSHRRLVAPTLKRSHIASYADSFVKHTRAWLDTHLADGPAEVDLHHELMAVTLDIVADTLFAAPRAKGVAEVGEAMERVMVAYIQYERTWRRLLPTWMPGSPWYIMARLSKRIETHVDQLIQDRQAGAPGPDLLSRMLEARDDEGVGLDQAGLRDEAITLFLAGHETTALALTFALYLLGAHPRVEQALRSEVEAALGDRPGTADDVAALTYTDAVVRETMRLYPPAWVVGRENTEPVVVHGIELPPRSQLLVPIAAMHRDPARFEDPDAFRPERWLGPDAIKPGRWDYLPFGGGERICVGNHFAMMEAVLVLATLIQGARFTPRRDAPPKLLVSITQRPANGLPMGMRRP